VEGAVPFCANSGAAESANVSITTRRILFGIIVSGDPTLTGQESLSKQV
jgi:hypothetical protein